MDRLHSPSIEALSLAAGSGDVAARLYRPAAVAPGGAPLLLHLHGGAFGETAPQRGALVAQLAAEAGAVVVDVDYPSGPRHPFPAALRLLREVLQALYRRRFALAGRRVRLFVAGEEAGGNLAAALALLTRDEGGPPLAGQVLIGPMLNPCLGTASLRQADAGAADCAWSRGWRTYLGACELSDHPYATPGCSSRLAGLAPALVITADDDPMRDESLAYARALRRAGVHAEQAVLAGPTGWPATLAQPVGEGAAWAAAWWAALRERLAGFLMRPAMP